MVRKPGKYVLFLAVLPAYRLECVKIIKERLGEQVKFLVSEAHLDPTVKTGIPKQFYQLVPIVRILRNRAFVQVPTSMDVFTANSVVVDLNPRSAAAWGILLFRRLAGRRTLVWGHIHPQAGANARTGNLRIAMRRLAHGTITYTYSDMSKARKDLPAGEVWVAPNALYPKAEMAPLPAIAHGHPSEVIYVGRFVTAKKVGLLIEGFSIAAKQNAAIHLRLVGGGEDEDSLRSLVRSLDITSRVSFHGWVEGANDLRRLYGKAFCSASPGFAGLGLTQSLGFGVPMLVADKEPHSPEIELSESGGVYWFDSDSPESLASVIDAAWCRRGAVPDINISEYTKQRYSAEAMANGIVDALLDKSPKTTRGEV